MVKTKRKNRLLILLLLLAMVCEFQFFNILSIDNIVFKLIETVAILAALVYCFNMGIVTRDFAGRYQKMILYINVVLIYVFGIELLYSVGINGVGIYSYLADSCRFLFLLALVPFVYVFENEELSNTFWKWFKRIVWLQFAINYLSTFLIRTVGINITNQNINYRLGTVNLTLVNALQFIALIYATYELIEKKEKTKLWNVLFLLVGLHHCVYISKNRATLVAFLIAIAVMLLTANVKRLSEFIRTIIVLSLIIAAIVYASQTGLFEKVFNMSTGEYASSNMGHIEAINECWTYFKNHVWLGAGFDINWPVSYADAGFIGLLANTGLGAFIIFGIPELSAIFFVLKRMLSTKQDSSTLLKGLVIYTLLTAITIILTDDKRMLGWVVVYAYIQATRYGATSNKEDFYE